MPSSARDRHVPRCLPTRRSADLGCPATVPRTSASAGPAGRWEAARACLAEGSWHQRPAPGGWPAVHRRRTSCGAWRSRSRSPRTPRSGEHTSELQSPCNLVCRLPRAIGTCPAVSLHDALPILDARRRCRGRARRPDRLAAGRRRERAWPRVRGTNDQPLAAGLRSIAVGRRAGHGDRDHDRRERQDRESTRLNSSHLVISYAVFRARSARAPLSPYTTLCRSWMPGDGAADERVGRTGWPLGGGESVLGRGFVAPTTSPWRLACGPSPSDVVRGMAIAITIAANAKIGRAHV